MTSNFLYTKRLLNFHRTVDKSTSTHVILKTDTYFFFTSSVFMYGVIMLIKNIKMSCIMQYLVTVAAYEQSNVTR
jgi:hypothetical protein